MTSFSYLSNADPDAIEQLYSQYKKSPDSIDIGWRNFFEGFEFSKAHFNGNGSVHKSELYDKEVSVFNLINAYRQRGHLFAKTNPIIPQKTSEPRITPEFFDLSHEDLETTFQAGMRIGIGPAKLKDIISHLEETYCGPIGVEYLYIRNPEIVSWLQQKMEPRKNKPNFSLEDKRHMLGMLNKAVAFENYLHTKFVGQKRFSLEGAETIIPALDAIIEMGADMGIEEFVIGMAHRGRLNVLANILGKTYQTIFSEFEGKGYEDSIFQGDVKYHLGYSADTVNLNGKKVHLSLCPNPSHLEAVNPVVEGISRAKIDFRYSGSYQRLAPILIHGDASISGQGIVYEVLQMSRLEGYKTGGTVHLVLNNQIGFTTEPKDGRSSTYCTDVAKTVLSPVFHVNGDDLESVVYVIKLAMEFRQEFHRDVFIDIVCYRKHGHNESDEPRYTQPAMYKIIEKHPNPREIYTQKLIESGTIEASMAKEMDREFRQLLDEQLKEAKQHDSARLNSFLEGNWKGFRLSTPEDFEQSPNTGITKERLLEIGEALSRIPDNLKFYPKIKKLFESRSEMIHNKQAVDWGMGELIAYGSLLADGFPVRLSGQDCERGTFSHRHAVIRLEDDNNNEFVPLRTIKKNQAPLFIHNSLLSEYGVLGFEYGYAMAMPHVLTIWEAQFGDFANGAQIIIDQFLSGSETKWQRMNGLVMLLPHGFEGQGPEHSSARIERFLALCAENNMQVANCSTPANLFHILRRQMKRPIRKPLVIMTPKSLLRHPLVQSSLNDFIDDTHFFEVIDDVMSEPKKIQKLLFCSGKVYYDLLEYRKEKKIEGTALIRIEQLYPFPRNHIDNILAKYSKVKVIRWVQEEPENMGANAFISRKLRDIKIESITRRESSTPATGFSKVHNQQQQEVLHKAFA